MTDQQLASRAADVAAFLKGLASEQRLLILCQLAEGEKCVGELIVATGITATSMSQHLAKLKDERIVSIRRDHRTLFYSIAHPATRDLLSVLHSHFCGQDEPNPGSRLSRE